MPVVTCPTCQARYDPGVDTDLDGMPDNVSQKVVCPACGQWQRLPEREPCDPPNVPQNILDEMKAQSRLVTGAEEPRPSSADRDEPRRGRRGRSRSSDEDDDRPRRRRDLDDDEDDRPVRRRRRHDPEDDYDDLPRRRASQAGQGLAIASMIVGIIAVASSLFLWCCCSFVGSIGGVLLGAVAVVLGFVSRSQGSRSGMGVTGIVTGFAAILLGVVLSILLLLGVAFMKTNQGKFGPGGGPGGGPAGQRNQF